MCYTHRIEVKTEREEIKQKKLTDIFFSTKSNKASSSSSLSSTEPNDQFILNRRIVLWLCKDLLPFKSIENRGFVDFWASLGFDTKLPSRNTVSVSALDDIYTCLKNELIIKLGDESIGMSIALYYFKVFH